MERTIKLKLELSKENKGTLRQTMVLSNIIQKTGFETRIIMFIAHQNWEKAMKEIGLCNCEKSLYHRTHNHLISGEKS